jgi:hypothetical protein
LSTGIASIARPGLNFSDAVHATLAAIGCSVGASACALAVTPALLRRRGLNLDQPKLSRYASAAALPLAVSGGSVLLPGLTVSLIAIVLLCALAYLSGSRGAATFLALHGAEQTQAASIASLAATLPALLLLPLYAATAVMR